MKNKLLNLFRNIDRDKFEKLLIVLVPVFTFIIIVSIIAPGLMLSRSVGAAVPVVSASPAPASAYELDEACTEAAYNGAVQQPHIIDGALYKYEFRLGVEGTILYKSGAESSIYPLDSNGDGLIDLGLKWVGPDENGTNGHYSSVCLFNADGTPLDEYDAVLISADSYTPPGEWEYDNGSVRYRFRDGSLATGFKTIGGKLYYFNQYGEAAKKLGVDVSFYNNYIDWPAVKSQGIDFAIIRVGGRGWQTGLIYDDSAYIRNINEAKKAGMKLGVYFYSTAVNAAEAEEEARYVVNLLAGTQLDYPVYIDIEQSGSYPRGRMDTLTKAERSCIVNAFCRVIISEGYEAGVYSSQHYFTTMIDFPSISRYNIWLAYYTYNNRMPSFSGHYELWQLTPSGIVRGISGVADINAVF